MAAAAAAAAAAVVVVAAAVVRYCRWHPIAIVPTILRQLQTAAQQPFLLACQALVQHQVWDVLVAKTGVRPPTLELRKGWVVLDDLVIGVVPHGKEFRILDLLKLGDLTGRDERRCVGRTWVCLRRNQSREDERESEWHSAGQGGERTALYQNCLHQRLRIHIMTRGASSQESRTSHELWQKLLTRN